MHCFKWEFCFQFACFQFVKLFQECIPGIKQGMPVPVFVSPAYFMAAIFFLWEKGGGGDVA
jgi:hypothetical protein